MMCGGLERILRHTYGNGCLLSWMLRGDQCGRDQVVHFCGGRVYFTTDAASVTQADTYPALPLLPSQIAIMSIGGEPLETMGSETRKHRTAASRPPIKIGNGGLVRTFAMSFPRASDKCVAFIPSPRQCNPAITLAGNTGLLRVSTAAFSRELAACRDTPSVADCGRKFQKTASYQRPQAGIVRGVSEKPRKNRHWREKTRHNLSMTTSVKNPEKP